ncbi:hypothetical protein KIW84_032916 [Lathyrus oleraceus]|uniref:Retrovirus-related Pol polyprotein from transposon TNT 1-94-like beta-barrel domain-containing protein n=1 Tax=Pisum sativum TaxID=3888 RepID=A0A9D4XX21_PEA|nr:hypothetical protein KIW84_032916 [Pisum sativum]
MRHHPKTTTKEEQVLQITSSREGSFGGVRGRGRGAFRGRGRGRGRFGFDKTQIECYRCHKFRHFQFECPSAENQVNYVEFNEEEELLLMAHVEIQGTKMEDLWFLDSGCNNHMSGIKKWFSDMDETFKHSVKLGNNARMTVHGKGSIKLKINGLVQVIKDVYYVPDLSNTLLSIGQLQERKLKIVIEDNTCRIYHPSKGVIMDTKMSANRMFAILGRTADAESCFQAITSEDAHRWHCRRDVVFEENGAWDWGRNDDHVNTTSNVLTWENDGEDIEGHEEDSFPEAVDTTHEQGHEEQESFSSNSSTARGCRTRREVRQPVYLQDYVSGDGLSEEEEEAMFIETQAFQVLTNEGDPLTYEEAAKHAEWRKAMQIEIEAIERNHTWELSSLPKAMKITAKKATSTNQDVIKEKDEGNTNKITTLKKASRKPPPTPKKRKQKEPQVQITDSDDGDLSPDTTKPTKKRKKQVKTLDTLYHSKIKATKVPMKKTSTPRICFIDPEPQSKKTPEQLESDNSIPGAEDSIKQPVIQQIIPFNSSDPSYHPTNTPSYHPTNTPHYHPTSPKDSTKESTKMDKPIKEMQKGHTMILSMQTRKRKMPMSKGKQMRRCRMLVTSSKTYSKMGLQQLEIQALIVQMAKKKRIIACLTFTQSLLRMNMRTKIMHQRMSKTKICQRLNQRLMLPKSP